MKPKELFIVLVMAIAGFGLIYFFSNRDGERNDIIVEKQNQNSVILDDKNNNQSELDQISKEKNIAEISLPTNDWTKIIENNKFIFQIPQNWEGFDSYYQEESVKHGYVTRINTIHTVERKAVGFEIQTPEDENRIVEIPDAYIQFKFEDLLWDEKTPNHQTGVRGNGDGNLTCSTPLEIYGLGSPIYEIVDGKNIEICIIENVEDASYGESLTAYIPLNNSRGLVISGGTSLESGMTIKEFLPIFKQVVSSFQWNR